MKKNLHPVSAAAGKWQLTAFPAGKYFLELTSGTRTLMHTGRCCCAGFSEVSSLPELLRLHRSEDGFSVEFESSGIIPFGQEFKVGRTVNVINGAAVIRDSIAACSNGQVGNISLEPIEFPGPWAKVSYMLYGSEKLHTAKFRENAEFYCGAEIPWYIQLEHHDGTKVEFISGSDVWRHRAGQKIPGVSSEFRLADCDGTFTFERHVLRYDAETPIEKRPWQFESLIAWSVPGESTVAEKTFKIPGCLASRAVQRTLRHEIRSAAAPLTLTGFQTKFCGNAAHLERPGKKELEHLDLSELFQLYCWGNRQLARKETFLTIQSDENAPAQVLLKNLSLLPEQLDDDDNE
ncbi:MAG: hypothetical protein IKA87_09060 [Lentisphaeria bacterium]|nr:hypothetical protein [Lentisphaeria bacterium]